MNLCWLSIVTPAIWGENIALSSLNTSRGELVDEDALINAVKSKGIRACIDVYSEEPPNPDSEMFKLDNAIFSPHIAGVTVESQQRFITETVGNVLKYVQGLQPLYEGKILHYQV